MQILNFQKICRRRILSECLHLQSLCYLSGSTGGKGYVGHATTLICAVHGFSSVRDLIKLRKEAIANDPLVAPIGPKGRHLKEFHKVPNKPSHIVIKFPGSDRSIVLRSQQRIAKNSTTKEAAIQYFMYASFKNGFFSKLSLAIFGLLLTTMTKYAWGRNLFIKYPKLFSLGAFSHEGPTEEQCRYATFQIDFNAKSANNQTLKTRVVGDIDPGYTGTAAMVSAAAVTVLKDIDLLPENGGVMTTEEYPNF